MNKISAFIPLFFLSVIGIAQVPYIPFQFDSSSWQESYYSLWFTESKYEVTVVGDTIIDDNLFFKLNKSGISYLYDDIDQIEIIDSLEIDIYLGAIRENHQKQVEFIKKNTNTPVTLFDFNFELGDTIQVYDSGEEIYINAKVDFLDTVEICGTLRNKYTIYFYEYDGWHSHLIDGIGSSAGIVPSYEYFESGSSLICYSKNSCDCFESIVSIEELEDNETQIITYPNPVTQNSFTVASGKGIPFKIEVYNSLGQLMFLNQIEIPIHSINCTNWESGFYLLKLIREDILQTKKIILH